MTTCQHCGATLQPNQLRCDYCGCPYDSIPITRDQYRITEKASTQLTRKPPTVYKGFYTVSRNVGENLDAWQRDADAWWNSKPRKKTT